MSVCIIHVRHGFLFIKSYMGKLRFALTNIIFWFALLFSCFLAENFAFLNPQPIETLSFDSAFFLVVLVIALLVFYYLIEHKKNALKFDKILLPAFIGMGLLMIMVILTQPQRTFISADGITEVTTSFSINEKIVYSLQIVIWLSIMYGLIFVYNRFSIHKEIYRFIAKTYVLVLLLFAVIDLFTEGNSIIAILNGTYTGSGLSFFLSNPNVWGLFLFSGLITTVLLSYKHFRWYYYTAMMFFYFHNFATTCTTTIYIGTFVVFAYTFYEIFSHAKRDGLKTTIKRLSFFLGSFAALILLLVICSALKVPLFVNLANFIKESLFSKNFSTLTGRSGIWASIFNLLKGNPFDLVFGLGYRTGTEIYRDYFSTSMHIKTAHNGVMEILLRHGLLGALVYLFIIGLTVYGLIKYIKRKEYRFAFFYGLCFLAIMLHSITESTTLFTPNVGGCYFGFVFILPILDIFQEKHFKELEEDYRSNVTIANPNFSFSLIQVLLYLAPVIILTVIIKQSFKLDVFCTILVLMSLLIIAIIIAVIIDRIRGKKTVDQLNNFYLFLYTRVMKG